MMLVIARAEMRKAFEAAERTMVAARDNNPLKLMADAHEALQFLLDPGERTDGFLDPIRAIGDACTDLRAHELAVIGKLFHVGKEPGQGQTMKLMNNLLSATAMAISSEAVVMGVKAGLDPQMIVDVINAGSGRNSATQDKIPRCVIPRTFDFGFALALLNKDVRLCMEEADAMGVPMIVGNSVRQLLAITAVTEGPNADMTDVMKSVERWAGVKVGSEVKKQNA